jgi:hypothetical protein
MIQCKETSIEEVVEANALRGESSNLDAIGHAMTS